MTAEEYIINELEKAKAENELTKKENEELREKNCHLECIVDTLKSFAKFDGEYVSIMVGGICEIKERNYLVKALDLKKEDENE